jgi:hypothetical protein
MTPLARLEQGRKVACSLRGRIKLADCRQLEAEVPLALLAAKTMDQSRLGQPQL